MTANVALADSVATLEKAVKAKVAEIPYFLNTLISLFILGIACFVLQELELQRKIGDWEIERQGYASSMPATVSHFN